jgi:peroxiredoxin
MDYKTLAEQTANTLNDFMASLPAGQQEIVAAAFKELLASNVADNAPAAGDQAPDFVLPNVRGDRLSLSAALDSGPVVLSFYRGSWCPFCNLELNALQQRMPEIRACGARLIAVSPEKPDSSLNHAEKMGLEFDVLSDLGNQVAQRYGLVMQVAESMRPLYLEWGLNLPAANGDDSYEIPVPATYVIDRRGTIQAAYVDKDYTRRMEPAQIINALQSIKTP